MLTPSYITGNEMLSKASIEDLKEYKKNSCNILRKNDQYATAKIVEEMFEEQIAIRKMIDEWNKLGEEYIINE